MRCIMTEGRMRQLAHARTSATWLRAIFVIGLRQTVVSV
jgi:hypothetical protein